MSVKSAMSKGFINAGDIKEFTSITSPYEAPQKPELEIDTGEQLLDFCVNAVMGLLQQRGIIQPL
jgi:adenylylsulfate kinase